MDLRVFFFDFLLLIFFLQEHIIGNNEVWSDTSWSAVIIGCCSFNSGIRCCCGGSCTECCCCSFVTGTSSSAWWWLPLLLLLTFFKFYIHYALLLLRLYEMVLLFPLGWLLLVSLWCFNFVLVLIMLLYVSRQRAMLRSCCFCCSTFAAGRAVSMVFFSRWDSKLMLLLTAR